MNPVLRRLNILHWPIWVKLAVGFVAAVLFPLLLLLVVGWNSVGEISLQNTRAYIGEIGARQQEIVRTNLDKAISLLNDFVFNQNYRRPLLSALRDTSGSEVIVGSETQAVSGVLQSALIKSSGGLYDSVWLLDKSGRVIALASDEEADANRPRHLIGDDEADSPAYQLSQNLELIQRTQDVLVYQLDSEVYIEVVTLIREGGVVAGYLVASIDFPNVIYNNLSFQGSDLPAYSFLVDSNGAIIASPEVRAIVGNDYNASIANRALERSIGIESYTIGSREVLGYYTPISLQGESEPRFALLTEVDRSIAAQQVGAYVENLSFPLIVGTVALLAVLVLLFNQLFAPPLVQLLNAIRAMAGGNFSEPVPSARRDEIGQAASAFADMRQQVQNLISDLQTRMLERVRDVEATQEISRFAASQRELQNLLNQVVDLIIARFTDIYHAQIFLLDDERQYAVLRASTGSVGKRLLERGHRLGVGSVSVIGQVTQEGRVIVARDTATSEIHRRNEFLPDTRAELAIPLLIGMTIIGALDVQSKKNGSFDEEEINVLQTMASQIAIAIQNAQLYQENLRRQEEIEVSHRAATLRAWEQYMAAQRIGELYSLAGTDTGIDLSDLRKAAIFSGQPVVGKVTDRQTVPVAVPIMLRGQALGAVEWELPVADFSANKVQLAQELVNRLAVSLDNARLFQESQRATERERLVNTIAARLTQQTDINEILQTAVREVGQALRAPQVNIRLHWADESEDSASSNGANGHG
jgi:GAF domain-containing protein/HAMP domain-containing protein